MFPRTEGQQFYFLVSGEIEYRTPEGLTQTRKVDTVHISDTPMTNLKNILQLQRRLQLQFLNRYESLQPEIINCVILFLTPLGVFTEEEFEAGTKQDE